MTMTAEQLAQLREVGEKRFLFTATVKHVEGYQTFFVDAETQEKAEAGIENGDGQIYEQELDVTDLDDFILDRVTTTDDFGDYPPISEADLVRMEYNAALCELLPGIQYMDLPDGGSITPLEQVRRMVADYRQRIAELEAISSAAEKLVRCKGRYHSEQNYCALAALFGVTTPDLPPLESEARTVTVKLPESVIDAICLTAAEIHNLGRGVSDERAQEIINSIRCAAGINLTVEG